MNQTVETAVASAAAPLTPQTAAAPQRLNEVVKRVKMELLSGRATGYERGAGFNPYDRGTQRDVWGKKRRA